MQHFTIPTCYFPSTALFLDDNYDFLLNFVLQLDERVAYRVFDVPHKALDYIHNRRGQLDVVSQQCLSEYRAAKNSPLINHTISLDLAAIHAEIYNPYRFSEVSVVVVDYAMPGMNGIEFCRLIENNNIKKILLTGQADEKLAIAAFNEGLIHRYVKKSDFDAAEQITNSIYELQHQYFQAMSDMVVRMLAVTPPRCLHEKKFAAFFSEFREKHGIVEYYLIDNSGSFLMLDDDANVSFFIVKNEDDLRMHYECARANGVSEDLLLQIATGAKIPAFWQASVTDKDDSSVFVDAKKCVSDETYYYAHLPGNVLFDVRQRKILSYHRYLEELDAEALLMD